MHTIREIRKTKRERHDDMIDSTSKMEIQNQRMEKGRVLQQQMTICDFFSADAISRFFKYNGQCSPRLGVRLDALLAEDNIDDIDFQMAVHLRMELSSSEGKVMKEARNAYDCIFLRAQGWTETLSQGSGPNPCPRRTRLNWKK
jgi:hypothetical protein